MWVFPRSLTGPAWPRAAGQSLSEESPDGRWRAFDREELLARDKASLDLFWLRDTSMTDLDNLPEPEMLAEEIMENLRAALGSFSAVAAAQLPKSGPPASGDFRP